LIWKLFYSFYKKKLGRCSYARNFKQNCRFCKLLQSTKNSCCSRKSFSETGPDVDLNPWLTSEQWILFLYLYIHVHTVSRGLTTPSSFWTLWSTTWRNASKPATRGKIGIQKLVCNMTPLPTPKMSQAFKSNRTAQVNEMSVL
jgi:hypothetical protein